MTFIEAAFTGIPYLSWSEVVIGDPLMRIAFGPGGHVQPLIAGDFDGDGVEASLKDFAVMAGAYLGSMHSQQQEQFDRYNDICDLNKDGLIDLIDFALFH